MIKFEPQLEILPESQKKLWLQLAETPQNFTLYGGTALALRLGHRESIDFDFFSPRDIDGDQLLNEIPYLANARIIDQKPNSLTCLVNGVQISYFGLKNWRVVHLPDIANGANIKVASIIDLAGTKLKVIQQRPSWKDYVDIHTILTKSSITLEEGLASGMFIYEKFNPLSALRALRYFEDVEGIQFTNNHKNDLMNFIDKVNLKEVEVHLDSFKR